MTRRVLLVTSSYAPHVGGVEQVCRQVALEQRRRGYDTAVVTNRYPKTLPDHEVLDGIAVHRARFRVPEPHARHLAGWLAGTVATRRQMRRLVATHHPDVLHVHCVSSNGYYALRVARERRLPLVVSLHGELSMDSGRAYERSRTTRAMWRDLIDRADAVTGCSQFVVDEAVAEFGQPLAAKAVVVPNGIDPDAVAVATTPASERPYAVAIGRLVPQKGFDLLIDAMHRLERTDLDLVVAGDGPEHNALAERALHGPARDRIRMLGEVSHAQVLQLLQGAAAFVLPSRHEPQGVVVLEAMACGTPVIAAAVGGVPETVRDGENGRLIAPDSAVAIADALGDVLADPAAARQRVDRATQDVRDNTWQHVADRYDEVYDRVIRRRR